MSYKATPELTREYDKVQAKVFMGKKNTAFLGSIVCSLDFIWDDTAKTPTAATDGIHFWWNPTWFMKLPEATRLTVMVHELWHVGLMHPLRRGQRDPKLWSYACDYRINNDLKREGYTFDGTMPLLDPSMDSNGILCEEEIYDLLATGKKPTPSTGTWGEDGPPDLIGEEGAVPVQIQQAVINTVMRAIQNAKFMKKAGDIPGNIEEMIDGFLKPVIPWEQHLMRFFTDLQDEEYTWARPNRRYQHIYLPSRFIDGGRLAHLVYFLDVSGSVTTEQEVRFGSELKYVQEQIKPARMTIVQFDTQIQKIIELNEGDSFTGMEIIGRGGTHLGCVKQLIDELKPTCAVIFSDMECAPMEELENDIPILWVALDNPHAIAPFGKMIHIES